MKLCDSYCINICKTHKCLCEDGDPTTSLAEDHVSLTSRQPF